MAIPADALEATHSSTLLGHCHTAQPPGHSVTQTDPDKSLAQDAISIENMAMASAMLQQQFHGMISSMVSELVATEAGERKVDSDREVRVLVELLLSKHAQDLEQRLSTRMEDLFACREQQTTLIMQKELLGLQSVVAGMESRLTQLEDGVNKNVQAAYNKLAVQCSEMSVRFNSNMSKIAKDMSRMQNLAISTASFQTKLGDDDHSIASLASRPTSFSFDKTLHDELSIPIAGDSVGQPVLDTCGVPGRILDEAVNRISCLERRLNRIEQASAVRKPRRVSPTSERRIFSPKVSPSPSSGSPAKKCSQRKALAELVSSEVQLTADVDALAKRVFACGTTNSTNVKIISPEPFKPRVTSYQFQHLTNMQPRKENLPSPTATDSASRHARQQNPVVSLNMLLPDPDC
jgi:hypothetical protein